MSPFLWSAGAPDLSTEKLPILALISAAALALILPWGLGSLLMALPSLALATPFFESLVYTQIAQSLAVSPFLGIARMVLGIPLAIQLIRLNWFGWGSAIICGTCLGIVTALMSGYLAEIPISALTMLIMRQLASRLHHWQRRRSGRSAQQNG